MPEQNIIVHVKVGAELAAAIDRYAAREGRNRSSAIRYLLQLALRQRAKEEDSNVR